jgi:pimeloyl-ACP methyl ester carboxylesterase
MVTRDRSPLPDDVVRRRIELSESGVEIGLEDWGGDGPLALLHHANGFCASLWAPIAERLRDRFRVVAMDARGHGESSLPREGLRSEAFQWRVLADDLLAVAERLLVETGESRIGLGLGHSFGGTLTLAAEARRPGLYERIVLVDPVIISPEWEALRREEPSPLIEGARRRRQIWPDRELARQLFSEKPVFADWTPRALDLYVEEGLRDRPDGQVELKCPGEVEALIFEASDSLEILDLASRVMVPALLLWAQQGNFPREVYEELAAKMGAAEIVDVAAGHLIPMVDPELIIAQVLDFCA